MGCGKYERIRAKDVGRPGHHYIKLGVRRTKGPRGGRTERIGGLRKYKKYRRKKAGRRRSTPEKLLREFV